MVRFFGGVLSSLMGCFPLSSMALGFSPVEQWRRCEVVEVYASGFAGYPGGYFIGCESALGVMTGWSALWNTKRQGFLPECEGFSLNSVYGSRIEDFLWILCQGAGVFACSAKRKFPNSFKKQ
jgi:hypothetical protein